jgi:hypothetical protein
MTPQQYIQALHDLQKPLVVQQKVVAAVAKQYGITSYQYRQEFEKEAKIIVTLYPQEMALLWEFRTACYVEKAKQKGKDAVLLEIIKEGKACVPEYKDGWRNVYKSIQSL